MADEHKIQSFSKQRFAEDFLILLWEEPDAHGPNFTHAVILGPTHLIPMNGQQILQQGQYIGNGNFHFSLFGIFTHIKQVEHHAGQ